EPTLCRCLESAEKSGFVPLAALQSKAMADFWQCADVIIQGNDSLQQGVRFNLFHCMQAAGRDGRTGMGAKGLSGEGYEGHYFWDTELYLLPVFTHTCPALSRGLLDYRYATLPQARARAHELGHPNGALYPWRTINGTEASAYYPLGTAQYHINADIAYAFWQYVTVTGELDYLSDCAAEVLCETARVWADVGSFSDSRDGKYCICCVTGPDEYNALVDNNFYTNLMARENLRTALTALSLLQKSRPAGYLRLIDKIKLKAEETALWQRIVDHMYLPHDDHLGIYLQDDGYLQRKPWDETQIPPEKRHLLFENYHPLFVFRHPMSKQADTILGLYLYDGLFDTAELRRNFE
ncbi:MAG: glycoside hydrolase family 65 protein, partial [Ruthenibacterium sp.]